MSGIDVQRNSGGSVGSCKPIDRREILRASLLPDAPEWAPLVADIDAALASHDIPAGARGGDPVHGALPGKVSLRFTCTLIEPARGFRVAQQPIMIRLLDYGYTGIALWHRRIGSIEEACCCYASVHNCNHNLVPKTLQH